MALIEFRTTQAVPGKASTAPAQATLTTVQGDSFDVLLTLQNAADSTLIDCSGWTWAARAQQGSLVLDFDTVPQLNGVLLHLAGTATERLPVEVSVPYDVAAFQPLEVDGRVVLSGTIRALGRVTSAVPPP